MSEDHEEGEQGVVKRESAWVFEAMCEITKAWKKEDQEPRSAEVSGAYWQAACTRSVSSAGQGSQRHAD